MDLIILRGCNYIQNISLSILYMLRDKLLESETFCMIENIYITILAELFMIIENL